MRGVALELEEICAFGCGVTFLPPPPPPPPPPAQFSFGGITSTSTYFLPEEAAPDDERSVVSLALCCRNLLRTCMFSHGRIHRGHT